VDMSNLSPEQRDTALHKFNAESCTCGCKFTLAQCRIYDAACQTSQKRTAEIIKGLSKAETMQPPKDAEQVPASLATPSETPKP
jgi:hypothetical protein